MLTAVYIKSETGFTGFVVELPGMNAHGRTIDETRHTLQQVIATVFDEERRSTAVMIGARPAVREALYAE